jgi:hypothetical protein
MDPQIERICGRADVAMSGFAQRVEALDAAGDYFGVHGHPVRWCDQRGTWVHDFADARWLRESTAFALDAFAEYVGRPAQLFRAGAGFLNNEIVDVLDARGVAIEMSLEPVSSWGITADAVPTAVDASPIVGRFVDCQGSPTIPYHPDPSDFRMPGRAGARRIVLVPMSTGLDRIPATDWRSRVRRVLGRSWEPLPTRTMFYLSLDWPSHAHFWDVVAYELRHMQAPYLSLAVRTDDPDSELLKKICRLLLALPSHPIARHLRFVDPLSAGNLIHPSDRTIAAAE